MSIYNRDCASITCVSRTIKQRNAGDDVGRLNEMPTGERLLRAGANSDREDVIWG